MRQVVLLGKPETKRTHFLGRAARETGLHVLFLDWDRWQEDFPEGRIFMKIDPPVWDSCSLEKLGSLIGDYQQQLEELSRLGRLRDVRFLNTPGTIATLLDKRESKRRLAEAGLAVSEELEAAWGEVRKAEQLLDIMQQRRIYQVFIKPVFGSGAAVVAAFRWQPRTGQMVLYTCAWEETDREDKKVGRLINTKKLRRFTDAKQVLSLMEKILQLGCIVERWYAKAEYQGYSYDLRAVVQDGKMDFCLARLSKGPITNLHLNNHPLKLGALGLSKRVVDNIEELCGRGMGCFPGLRSAGIDVLLERGSLKPRIIEMNAQGDLLYQDIYGENVIYQRQVEIMKKDISYGG